ncbi:sugar porter family MFS transporter [Rhodococcus sp. NPDC057014]|uniref:sugar porter family MFS transporter n=1 Tax=Rhodococcus sp. NPDC057014 TaxID=3346000 RepID=UPI00362D71C3
MTATASEDLHGELRPTPSKIRPLVIVAACVSALGGFLFGFDTGIISGALLSLRDDLSLSEGAQQLIVSSLLVGAAFGAYAGGPAADRLGRRKTVLVMAALFAAGATVAAVATGVIELVAARVILGVAVGAASTVVPVYIAELAPARVRGILVLTQELMITVGILCSYIVSYNLSESGNWRLMLGSAALPAVALFVGMLFLPESPRWLVGEGRESDAEAVLSRTCGTETEADEELTAIHSEAQSHGDVKWREFLAPAIRPAMILGIGLPFFSQVVGINAVIYYAPSILSYAGLADSAAILATVGVGIVMVITTALALVLVDRIGRRPFLVWGTLGVTASLFAIGGAFLVPEGNPIRTVILICGLLAYIGTFSVSLALFWLVIAEIWPSRLRSKGMALGSLTHWIMNFVVAGTVLTLLNSITATGMFWLYGLFGIACMVFVRKYLPETSGKTLEQVSEELIARSNR